MSSKSLRFTRVAMVAAVPALIIGIIVVLPSALTAGTGQATGAGTGHVPAALSALASLHSLAVPPAPPAPPEPPDTPAPRAHRVRHNHPDGADGEERAWLGVTLSDIDEEGALVAGVADDSPAAEAGLEKGDRIISIEGKKILSSRDVVRSVRAAAVGDKVRIRILRDESEKTLTATLAGRRSGARHEYRWVTPEGEDIHIETPDPTDFHGHHDAPDAPGHRMELLSGPARTWLGVELHHMSPELREAFKAPSDRGVLINKVVEDSPAASGGLRAGDIIIAVAGKGVSQAGDIGRVLRDSEAGDSVDVRVVRDGSERTIEVRLEDRPGPSRRRGGFYVGGGLLDDDRIVIEKSVREAMRAASEAMREASEQLRSEQDRMRVDQDEIRKELQKEMKELKEKIRVAPLPVIRARTIHDI